MLEPSAGPAAGPLGGAITFAVAFVVLVVLGRVVVLPLLRRVLEHRDLDDHARKPLVLGARIAIVFVALAVAFGLAE